MNMEQFYSYLKELPAKGWRPVLQQGTVRLFDRKERECCPITAVCLAETGQLIADAYWRKAADLLGLSLDAAHEIVHAADMDGYQVLEHRDHLLAVLGLDGREK